jgi:Acetoacetate decarboxylase (ADC)
VTAAGPGPGEDAPPAPWRSEVDALVWWHRAAPGARAALPAALAARARVPLTLAGLVAYRAGPVGPYREVLASPVLLRGRPGLAHVPFMAVDSPASLAGGRANWALPKVLAAFSGTPGRSGTVAVRGEGWALAVTARARRRALPAWGMGTCAQVWPDGEVRAFSVRMGGWARLASVEVRHDADSPLAAWLLPGRHPAVLLSGRQVVSPPR